jgi:hypothetical protein
LPPFKSPQKHVNEHQTTLLIKKNKISMIIDTKPLPFKNQKYSISNI